MKFQHLKTERCPHCGSEAVGDFYEVSVYLKPPQINVHVNGQRWETRKFLCGLQIQWVPNFTREVESEYHACQNSAVVIKKNKKRAELAERLLKATVSGDADEKFVLDLQRAIKASLDSYRF